MDESSRIPDVIAEIVTYDPVRQRGFLRVQTPSPVSTVLFHRRELPEPLADGVLNAAPELQPTRRRKLTTPQFKDAMARAQQFLRGRRLRFDGELRADGHLRMVRGTVGEISGPPDAAVAEKR